MRFNWVFKGLIPILILYLHIRLLKGKGKFVPVWGRDGTQGAKVIFHSLLTIAQDGDE
jgi:hypothetical protein